MVSKYWYSFVWTGSRELSKPSVIWSLLESFLQQSIVFVQNPLDVTLLDAMIVPQPKIELFYVILRMPSPLNPGLLDEAVCVASLSESGSKKS